MERLRIMLFLLVIGLTFAATHQSFGDTQSDLEAIRELFVIFERGYEEHDLDKYMSVFTHEEYEYIADMGTPDDPTDDVHILKTEEERRSAERVFNANYTLDLELTEPEIKIDGDSAEVRNEIRIVGLIPERPVFPEVLYATSSNFYSLKKLREEWKIVHWEQREAPIDELEASRQEEIADKDVETLIQDLSSDSMMTWAMAISDLKKGKTGESDIAALVKALQYSRKGVRYRLIWVLSGTENEAAIDALVDILSTRKNSADIRAAAAKALINAHDPAVDEELLAAARLTESKVTSAACLTLSLRLSEKMGEVRKYAVRTIRHRDETIREELTRSLGLMMSANGADLLEASLEDKNESQEVRLAALGPLSGLQLESSLRLFRGILTDRDEPTALRRRTARALGEAKDRQALETLMAILRDENESLELRRNAADALGLMGDPGAADMLMDFLESPEVALRRQAARSLGRLKYQPAMKSLTRILRDRDEDAGVRAATAKSVFEIDQDGAFDPLVQIMKDKNEPASLRRAATYGLVRYKDGRSVPLFLDVLNNKAELMRFRRLAINHLKSARYLEGVYQNDAYIQALETAAEDEDDQIARIAQETLNDIEARSTDEPDAEDDPDSIHLEPDTE